jgi:hypothetical protein
VQFFSDEIAKCFVLPLLSLNNIILQMLEKEVGVRHNLRRKKAFKLSNEQDRVPCY